MTIRSIACLGAGLLGCIAAPPAPAALSSSNELLPAMAIVQCTAPLPPDNTTFLVSAVSTSPRVRQIDVGGSCAREIRNLLDDGFRIRSTFADQFGQVLVYTLTKDG